MKPAPLLRALSRAASASLPSLLLLAGGSQFTATALAAVPHRWTVEASRVAVEPIEAFRGEGIDLEASLNAYGKPLELPSSADYFLYWQTNGMGTAYWVTNAALSASNVLSAAFRPEYAPAAGSVRGFVGSPDSSYRAAFTIRFRDAPGATPNELPVPTVAIDFSKVTVYNPPYYTKSEIDAALSDYALKSSLSSLAPLSSLTSHTNDTSNPHEVTAAQVGVTLTSGTLTVGGQSITPLTSFKEQDPIFSAWTNGLSIAAGKGASASQFNSTAIGYAAQANGEFSTAIGSHAYTGEDDPMGDSKWHSSVAFSANPEKFYFMSIDVDKGEHAKSLQSYLDERATTNAVAELAAKIPVISATNAAFSNAVLAVTTSFDTNTVAQINKLLDGGTVSPIEVSTGVGAALAAIAAALAALKKSLAATDAKVSAANTALEEVA